MSFSALFSFAVLITGCIVISIVLNKHKDLPSRLLAFSLFSLSFTVLLIFLFESKYLLYVPFLFRTGSFFYYLVMPSFYLYAVFVLKSRKNLRWTDALHALPALIYFIDFAPLFFSSTQDKLAIIRSLLSHDQRTVLHYNEGWFIPQGIHFLAPIVLGFVYIFFIGRMLLKYYRSGTRKKVLFRWLITATSLYFLLEAGSLLDIDLYTRGSMATQLHLRHDILFYHKPRVVFKSGSFVRPLFKYRIFKGAGSKKNKTVNLTE